MDAYNAQAKIDYSELFLENNRNDHHFSSVHFTASYVISAHQNSNLHNKGLTIEFNLNIKYI